MKSLRVVADSSCLIGLAQIKQFNLLKELFLEVYISEAVFDEVIVKGKGEVGSEETKSAIKDGWIIKKSVMDEVAVRALSSILGEGESEVIVLYKELGADYALIDETTARDIADLMDVNTMGFIRHCFLIRGNDTATVIACLQFLSLNKIAFWGLY